MNTIASLHEFRQHLHLAEDDTSSDSDLLSALKQATSMLESITRRRYCPYLATLTASINLNQAGELILPDDLLLLTSITNGDGTPINLDNVLTIPDRIDSPVSVLRLINGESFRYSESPIHAVSITGVWGWHERWSEAWRDSGDSVQDNPLSDSATTITVSDADGADHEGVTPRFQVGHLLKIESEYLRVVSIDTANNQLIVLRGVNGTTAVGHAQDTDIATYQPVAGIRTVCLRYAELVFNSTTLFDSDTEYMMRKIASAWRRISA